jgi:hypothetical protein
MFAPPLTPPILNPNIIFFPFLVIVSMFEVFVKTDFYKYEVVHYTALKKQVLEIFLTPDFFTKMTSSI